MAATYILPLKAICNLSASVVFRFRGPLALGAILPQTRMVTGFFAFFKNLPEQHRFNEMYAKDTSRKIKSALHARRMQGKYMATTAPFGYQKDEKDHNHLVIDEVTAPVVELIFSIAEEGVGLHTICNRLRKAKVIKPSFYKKEMFERYTDEEKMYDWDTAYVSKILRNPVYAGNL